MKPILVILNGERAGERLLLEDAKRYIIGRDQTTDICLPEKKISRRHACLYWEKAGMRVVIEDLSSLNGTSVNGEMIAGSKILQNADRIQIGSYILQLQIQEIAGGEDDHFETDRKPLPAEEIFEKIEPIDLDQSEPSMTGGRMIHGRLQDIALADLLQMLGATRKSGLLVLSTQKLARPPVYAEAPADTAFIYINQGDVDFAAMNDLDGEDAFFEALRKKEGFFALFPLSGDVSYNPTITTPLEALLLEGFRRLDEEKARGTKIASNDTFEVQPEEPLDSLSSEELKVFQLIWKHKKYSVLLENSPFDKPTTADLVKKLLRGGFIKKIKKSKS